MSQSDYIQFKKTATNLKELDKYPAVLDPESYTDFAAYNLETTVANTKNAYSRLLPTGKKYFFNIEKNVSACPTFILCENTNTRVNRELNTEQKIVVNGTQIPFTPTPTFRFNKVYTEPTCTYTNVYNSRKYACNKKICKCRTQIYTR